jgi:hypothetical protein
MRFYNFLYFLALASAPCFANVIQLPLGAVTVPSGNSGGFSFVYNGTLTQADSIDLIQTGDPCLQSGPAYCTNGAGVVTTAGTSPVGDATSFIGTFGGTTATWTFGSLLMEISTVGTVPVFGVPDAADGLGSSTPPLSLAISASLSSLGFGAFSVTDPTITFVLADNFYPDNSGTFVLDQAPEPSTLFLVAPVVLLWVWFRRRSRA